MSRSRTIAVWTLQVLLAIFFVLQAWMKLGGSPAWIARFHRWGYPDHFYLVVGAVELLGGLALVVPPLTRIAAAGLTIIMVGATVTHLLHREPQVISTVVLIALLSIVVYSRRPQKIPGSTASTRAA
jgi:uncharacterized membrane protein YphA (DoxX/SURF4 family)